MKTKGEQAYEKALVNALFEKEDEVFMVDNSCLKSDDRGLQFRNSPRMEDLDTRPGNVAEFGKLVSGVSFPEEWVLVDGFGKRRFLPKAVQGIRVLRKASELNEDPDSDEEPARRTPAVPAVLGVQPEDPLLELVEEVLLDDDAVAEGLARLNALLKNMNTDVDVRDRHGLTPLMRAARRGNLDYIVALVRAGADLSATNEGRTAGDFATCNAVKAILGALCGRDFINSDLMEALDMLQGGLKDFAAVHIQGNLFLRSQLSAMTNPTKPKVGHQLRASRSTGNTHIVLQDTPVYDEQSLSSEQLNQLTAGDLIEILGCNRSRTWATTYVVSDDGEQVLAYVPIMNSEGEVLARH